MTDGDWVVNIFKWLFYDQEKTSHGPKGLQNLPRFSWKNYDYMYENKTILKPISNTNLPKKHVIYKELLRTVCGLRLIGY